MKRRIFTALILSSAVCTTGVYGCNSQQAGQTPASQSAQSDINPEKSTNKITDKNHENNTTKASDNTSVKNLTDDLGIEVCIDYEIDSYAPVQDFSYRLFKENIDSENPVLSPISAYLALSMAAEGASGDTEKEFIDALGGGEDNMLVYSDNIMNNMHAESEGIKLSINNSAWLDNSLDVNTQWLGTVKSLMDADIFQSQLSDTATMNAINDWTSTNTNGLIDKLLTEPLSDAARLALINTVYFKADWQEPFDANDTRTEEFTLEEGKGKVEVEMMNKYYEPCQYIANDFAEGVILPYKSPSPDISTAPCNLAFVALKQRNYALADTDGGVYNLYSIPADGTYNSADMISNGIREDVYNKLTAEVIADLLANVSTETVNLKLPKFEITFDKILNNSLENMGIKNAFDAGLADFGGIGTDKDGQNIFISLVRQKAKIIVDEQGTEAAAATEAIMECGAAEEPQQPIELYFDSPFVYMIVDMNTEIPLFIGIMDNPSGGM